MAAIFNLPLTPMLDSVRTSSTELLDPDNVDVAFGISLLTCHLVYELRYKYFRVYGRHLGFTNSVTYVSTVSNRSYSRIQLFYV